MQTPNASATRPTIPEMPVERLSRRFRAPAWLISTLLHASLLISSTLLLRDVRRNDGVHDVETRTAGIAVVRRDAGATSYFDGHDNRSPDDSPSATAPGEKSSAALDAESLASPLPRESETTVDLAGDLPSSLPGGGSRLDDSSAGAGGTADVGQLQGGGGAPATIGGRAKTSVYGIDVEGSRFVYVFDRSGSMSGFGGRPLRSAQAELMHSLQDLGRVHQFQIIFYNEKPRFFSVDGSSPQLHWGDEVSKQLATSFIRGIDATGGTEHMSAITMALRLNPDIIFFLTDADEPQLSQQELDRVERLNQGATIHAIEFGFGPQRTNDNFLVQLARGNNGEHRYVDISQLPE